MTAQTEATHRIAGLILAAGESTRMGRDKALLMYRGSTFLESIITTLRGAGSERIVVVLGHHAADIERATNLANVEVLINADYRRGQTSSLQRGLKALMGEPVEGVVLSLVDHPAVRAETIAKLIATFTPSLAPVVIPTHQGQRGHPVLIGRALFEELLGLPPDAGANTVIRKYRASTQWVEVDDAGVLTDVDDLEAYQKFRSSLV
ncbi:MAG TPA: nucleotidyltransferase family protein [Terriglobia bacterium]|nr:nucleotidyltransferase family protein [Terriglobia bacterium]